ncbi:CstA-like transporter-associated (seleno)protein, partial [Streptomyces sp. AS02]
MTAAPQHQPTDPLWRRCWSSLRWWVRGVTGADAYDNYLEWCRRTRHEPMSEKAF